MAIPEQFSLRWNDFHSNLSQSFQSFLAGEDLVDVTLAADGQYVHAHKLILSVCSPYFKELFKMNPCEHPIVFLKDVSRQELQQLLQFMYRGEVHVRQHELPAFLHTAELLQVKGLTATRERSSSPAEEIVEQKPMVPLVEREPEPTEWHDEIPSIDQVPPHTVNPDQPAHAPTAEDEPRSPLKRLLKNTPNKNNYNVKKKPRPVNDGVVYPENADYGSDSEPLIDFDNDFKMIHHHSVLVLPKSAKEAGWNCKSGGVKCPSCHRMFANRYNLKVHIRDKHDTREGTLQCAVCHKRMRNPSCLRVHMYHHRKQAAYLAQLAPSSHHSHHAHHHLDHLLPEVVGVNVGIGVGVKPEWCEGNEGGGAATPAPDTAEASENTADMNSATSALGPSSVAALTPAPVPASASEEAV